MLLAPKSNSALVYDPVIRSGWAVQWAITENLKQKLRTPL